MRGAEPRWTRRSASLALALAAVGFASLPALDAGATPPPAKDWEVEIAPYGWLAMLHGRVDTPRSGSEEFTLDAGEVIDGLDLGAMGAVKLRWRRFVAIFDVAWAKLSSDDEIGDSQVRYDVTQKLGWFMALGGYRVYERPGGLFGTPAPVERRSFGVDLLGGLTYSWSKLELDLTREPLLPIPPQERRLRPSDDWVAPYLGIRFVNDFTDHLRHETLLGLGGFGVGDAPRISWQVTSLFSYSLTEHFFLSAGYRALSGRDPDLRLTFHGPIIGAGFRF